jgi:murein hydrolase activator
MSRATLAIFALLLFQFSPVAAQEIAVPTDDARGQMLMEIIATLERDLEDLGRKRRKFNRQKEEMEQRLALLQEHISRADSKLKESRKQIEKLLRSVVLMKEPDDLLLFFSTMRYHDLHVYRRSIKKITVAISRQLALLVERKKKMDRQKGSLLHKSEGLNARRQALLAEIDSIEKVARQTRTELTERTRKIAAIESLFMTGGFTSPYVTTGAAGHRTLDVAQPPEDLGLLRGLEQLQIPVSPGKLIKGFEEMPKAPYGTGKMVRGWILLPFVKGKKRGTTDTAFVRVPFPGIIVFLGEVPGFGMTIVVDHGHGYHTVYSNLYKTHIVKGDFVGRTQTIGTVKTLASDGAELPYLYFELRQNRIAIDPKDWFLLRPLKAGERRI